MVFGGTLLNLNENPLTQKANYGTEPVNNTMIGFNTNFSTELPFLTRWVNKIPTINRTNVPSMLSFRGEVANLISGKPKNTHFKANPMFILMILRGPKPILISKGLTLGNSPVFLTKTLKVQRSKTTTSAVVTEGPNSHGIPLILSSTLVEGRRG